MKARKLVADKDKLAYIIGLALGDGNLSNPNGRAVRLRITCDVKYPKLIQRIKATIQHVLPENKVSIVLRKKNCVDVSCFSNHWEAILGWYVGKGSKFAQKVSVPDWIKTNADYAKWCLKGLIETDGSVYFDRGYPMVMYTSIIPNLTNDANSMIELLGFKPHIYQIIPQNRKDNYNHQKIYHIRLSKNVTDFLAVVKPEKN